SRCTKQIQITTGQSSPSAHASSEFAGGCVASADTGLAAAPFVACPLVARPLVPSGAIESTCFSLVNPILDVESLEVVRKSVAIVYAPGELPAVCSRFAGVRRIGCQFRQMRRSLNNLDSCRVMICGPIRPC